MSTDEFVRGTQVLYVPDHAEGNPDHPDCEAGFVTRSARVEDRGVYVRYFHRSGKLRTTANSEYTSPSHLIAWDTRPQIEITNLLLALGYGEDSAARKEMERDE